MANGWKDRYTDMECLTTVARTARMLAFGSRESTVGTNSLKMLTLSNNENDSFKKYNKYYLE